MLFFVQTVIDATARATLKRKTERHLHFATDRFERHIRDLGVVLRDVNGPHGGIDKVCRVTAKLRRGGRLEVEEKRASFMAAISAAAKRLRRLLARRIGGKTTRHAFGRDREPYRRAWKFL
jgi:putative sigma-54 modulation protein